MDAGGDVTFGFAAEDGRSALSHGCRSLQWRIDGSAIGDDDFLLCVNMDHRGVDFALPSPREGGQWLRIIDTARWAEPDGNRWTSDRAEPMGPRYGVHPYAIAVFQERAPR
jgi:glycogen operon protein